MISRCASLLVDAQDAADGTEDLEIGIVFGVDDDGFHVGIGWDEVDETCSFFVSFDGCATVDHGSDEFAIFGSFLRSNDDDIAGHDAIADHARAADAESVAFFAAAAKEMRIEFDGVVEVFFVVDG